MQCITLACCTLHNYLKQENKLRYTLAADNEDQIDERYMFKYALSQQKGDRPRSAALKFAKNLWNT